MVRQDSQLWDDLHQGVLTSGKLNASLGFYEPRAAHRLGIGRSLVSHHHLLSAFHHLQDEVYTPPANFAQINASSGKEFSATKTGNKEWRERRCEYAALKGSHAVRMSWGTAQEAATLYGLMHALPGSSLMEAGLFLRDSASLPSAWGFIPGQLPPLGASPDGLLWHPRGVSSAKVIQCGFFQEDRDDIASLLDNLEISQSQIANEREGVHPLSMQRWQETCSGGRLEVVEVKNSSPFWQHRSGIYSVSDRGPALQVLPLWVPQLQMEMLAADVQSALLVSRSATKGMSLFRVSRDDRFLRQMLNTLRRFYLDHVKARRQPPCDMFFERHDYQELINQTLCIARKSTLLAHVASPAVHPDADRRPFID